MNNRMAEDNLIPFSALEGIKNISSDYTRFGDDYIFARIDSSSRRLALFKEPIRVAGLTVCVLMKGSLSLEINMERIDLTPVSVFIFNNSAITRICDADWADIDAYVLFLSLDLIQDLHIEHNNLKISPPADSQYAPMINGLADNEIDMLSMLMDLIYRNACVNEHTVFTHNVSKSLIQALIYQLFQIKVSHHHTHVEKSDKPMSRRIGYMQDFMRLVQTHYRHERSLKFYADRMFISPKYMSRIIKDATGRSAADWIDHFVVQEAKNMLRFSNKSIQQVAYALNFPTQSSFGKFFKHMTGMSPSEYQQS